MQRKMKLIRKLLTHVECFAPEGGEVICVPEIEGYSAAQVQYHVYLCREAGYIRTPNPVAGSGYTAISGLTWAGHDALDRLRTGEQ